MIFFSIVIPTYNRAHLITETLDSVLAQTYPHFEVIIVDDGSTDNTRQILEENYGASDRVRYFYRQNEERGAARNFGIGQAKGDYVVFFDSDDWMMPHYLETLKNIIEKYPGIFLLATCYNYNANGKTETHPELHKLEEGWYTRNFFLKGNMLACNYCIRIRDCSYTRFPEEREMASMEDWLFLLLNLRKEKIFIKAEVCVTMRQHDERSMLNNQKVIEARKKATVWTLQHLDLTESEKNELVAWSHYFCAVHQYLDYNRAASVQEALSAIKEAGLKKKYLLILIKSVIGRKIIRAVR